MKKTGWFTIKTVKPRIYALAEFKHPEEVVSYLVVGKKQAALFDTGTGGGDIKKEIEALATLPVKVYLTHKHWDHVGGWSQFVNQPKRVDFEIQKITTPGHSSDSVCYFLPEFDVLVSGDTLYPGPIYLHLEDSDFREYERSLSKLRRYVGDETVILPGHNAVAADAKLYFKAARAVRLIGQGKIKPKRSQDYYEYSFGQLSFRAKTLI